MKCQLLRTHLVTRDDAYELIRRKNLCLACMKPLANNPAGDHHCVLVREKPNKEKYSVICPVNCRFAGSLLNRFWCRCGVKRMKENQAEVASSNTRNPPPTNDNPGKIKLILK